MLIEKQLFTAIKPSLERDLGDWSGSKEQNSVSDLKVATTVKNSFRYYEKTLAGSDSSFFNF